MHTNILSILSIICFGKKNYNAQIFDGLFIHIHGAIISAFGLHCQTHVIIQFVRSGLSIDVISIVAES